MPLRNCEYCGDAFEVTDPKSKRKYCKKSHRNSASLGYVWNPTTKRGELPKLPKALGEIVTPLAKTQSERKPMNTNTPQLDTLGSFMVRTVERERDKIEADHQKLKDKYEALQKEKLDLKEQLDEVTRKLTEKPTGLSGVISGNPDLLKSALEMGMPMLAGIMEKIGTMISSQPGQKQLAATTQQESGEANPVWVWIVAQPQEVQVSFVALLEKLDAIGKTAEYLESWNRQLMRVVPKTNMR